MGNTSSITDIPITTRNENILGIEHYADALARFIKESATPLTIGMQGEWGTGKTSLMYLVKEVLDTENIATSWVNTWEYSLFKGPAETTPAVLNALLQNLVETCKKLGYWSRDQKYSEIKDRMIKGAKILGVLAAKVAVRSTTGTDIDIDTSEQTLSVIAELKKEIGKIVDLILNDEKNPLNKVVFFVDDLDRIDPPTAIEVLEALKNIFDINSCVFILAIDYEVVIKGLEKKFGKKTEQNEREFRSFFDKIIQVPFSMPTSAYNVDNLLKQKLNDLGLVPDKEFESDYVQIVKLTVGFNPRSIKRYINSFSLLKKIKSLGESEKEGSLSDFCLFALLGIQISYPKIYRLICKEPVFISWNEFFAKQNGVDEIKVPDKESEFTDEEWEQVIWSYCLNDPYLKARAIQIIQALNFIREKIEEEFSILTRSMEFASMTSVDDDVETKHTPGKYKRTYYEGIDGYKEQLKSANKDMIELLDHLCSDLKMMFEKETGVNYVYSQTMGVTLFAKNKTKGTKFAGLAYSNAGGAHIELTLLKDPRNQYKKPVLDGLTVRNVRSYKSKRELQVLPFIEFYIIELKRKSDYTDNVRSLVKQSYEIRDQEMETLKKGMPEVEMSVNEG